MRTLRCVIFARKSFRELQPGKTNQQTNKPNGDNMKNPTPINSTKPLQRALLAIAFIALTGTIYAAQRPITDFTSRQGTYCLKPDSSGNVDCAASGYNGTGCALFVPPQPNVGGWIDPTTAIFTLVDYAGLADKLLNGALGTTLDGSVTEVPLADGRAEVTV